MGKQIHGHRSRGRSPTYNTWRSMVARCHNPKSDSYEFYGAKGITVCPEWLTFAKFLSDMGARPKGHTLDRIDSTLGYFKANCRWEKNTINCSRYKK